MSAVTLVPIKLENLLIDLHNPRYDPRNSQRDALATISHDQGQKLYNLAEDIVEKGLNPSELLLVAENDNPGFYIVLEGNRRVAALKLLSSPSLLTSLGLPTGLLKKYNALIDRAQGNLPVEVPCAILPREDAKGWILLKHTGENEGIGIVTWDGRARHRFRGESPALQAIDLVEASNFLDKSTREMLPKIAITNIERLLGTPEARRHLGVEVKNEKLSLTGPEDAALGRLALVVTDVASRAVRVTDLHSKNQRIAYAKDIANRPLPKPIKKAVQGASKPSAQPRHASQISPNRSTLIPKPFRLHIPQTRINRIFSELQMLPLDLYINSCAVLLRVFVELSVDEYAQRHHLALKVSPKRKKGSKTAAQPRSLTLREKLKVVAENLEARQACSRPELQAVRTLASNRNHVLSVDTLNAYVHNPHYNPNPSELKATWDNIQVFIERLWKT